jgi:hypothetical protein
MVFRDCSAESGIYIPVFTTRRGNTMPTPYEDHDGLRTYSRAVFDDPCGYTDNQLAYIRCCCGKCVARERLRGAESPMFGGNIAASRQQLQFIRESCIRCLPLCYPQTEIRSFAVRLYLRSVVMEWGCAVVAVELSRGACGRYCKIGREC